MRTAFHLLIAIGSLLMCAVSLYVGIQSLWVDLIQHKDSGVGVVAGIVILLLAASLAHTSYCFYKDR